MPYVTVHAMYTGVCPCSGMRYGMHQTPGWRQTRADVGNALQTVYVYRWVTYVLVGARYTVKPQPQCDSMCYGVYQTLRLSQGMLK